jgi:hypothetical protein
LRFDMEKNEVLLKVYYRVATQLLRLQIAACAFQHVGPLAQYHVGRLANDHVGTLDDGIIATLPKCHVGSFATSNVGLSEH